MYSESCQLERLQRTTDDVVRVSTTMQSLKQSITLMFNKRSFIHTLSLHSLVFNLYISHFMYLTLTLNWKGTRLVNVTVCYMDVICSSKLRHADSDDIHFFY